MGFINVYVEIINLELISGMILVINRIHNSTNIKKIVQFSKETNLIRVERYNTVITNSRLIKHELRVLYTNLKYYGIQSLSPNNL